jgi:NAD(P)-dependent dehydrogenase (short-subunit alcohol dehydrogenase family)
VSLWRHSPPAQVSREEDDFLTVQTDLTNHSAVDEITKATRARFGRIDILVNNAEIGPGFDHGAARAQLS